MFRTYRVGRADKTNSLQKAHSVKSLAPAMMSAVPPLLDQDSTHTWSGAAFSLAVWNLSLGLESIHPSQSGASPLTGLRMSGAGEGGRDRAGAARIAGGTRDKDLMAAQHSHATEAECRRLIAEASIPGVVMAVSDQGRSPPVLGIASELVCVGRVALTGRWGFQWALTCSRPRPDGFGGGAHVLELATGMTIEWLDCEHWLAGQLAAATELAPGAPA